MWECSAGAVVSASALLVELSFLSPSLSILEDGVALKKSTHHPCTSCCSEEEQQEARRRCVHFGYIPCHAKCCNWRLTAQFWRFFQRRRCSRTSLRTCRCQLKNRDPALCILSREEIFPLSELDPGVGWSRKSPQRQLLDDTANMWWTACFARSAHARVESSTSVHSSQTVQHAKLTVEEHSLVDLTDNCRSHSEIQYRS